MSAEAAALHGVRVLDLGHAIAGPFAARLLGDLGADVVKLERPGDGDRVRRAGPHARDAAGRERSGLFELLNWGKRSVACDLADPASHARVRSLVERADVVVESFRPGRLAGWGLAPETLRAWNERLVVVSVTSFGQSGPYAGWHASDLVVQAMSGTMQISGTSGRPPLKHGLRQSAWCAGMNAAYAALAGLLAARRTGAGAHVDLSVHECMASALVMNESLYAFLGAVQGRRPPQQDPFGGDPQPTADGWLSLQTSGLVGPERYAALFDDPRLAEPRFATPELRTEHGAELRALLAEHLGGATSRELFERAAEAGLLAGFDQGAAELLACPQLAAREAFASFEGLPAEGEPWRFPARLASLSETPARVRGRAPELGEHTAELQAELAGRAGAWAARERPARGAAWAADDGSASDGPSAPAAAGGGDAAPGPLAGLRVLDLSTVFAAPYLCGLLADLGAEVIKVEAPHRLDQTRTGFGACFDNDPRDASWDRTTTFQVLNRGKRAVALNLATPAGRELLLDLVRRSDVLVDNFTPRVMRGWGTTYERLAQVNPRLVMLSNTGYGSTGPWAEHKAQGTTLEVTMGLAHYSGYRDGPPAKVGQSHPDFLACWSGLTALLAALVARERTGRGQWIDLGMYQLGAAVVPEALLAWQADGEDLSRTGAADLDAALSGLFPAAGEDRWLAVSVPDEDGLRALAAVVPGVDADPERALAAWAAEREAGEAAALLQAAGVPAGPLLDARDLLLDPHLRARGFYEALDFGPELGARPLIGRPFRWDSPRTAVAIRGRAPAFAEGNEHVLRGLLRLGAERVAELEQQGVVARAPRGARPMAPLDLGAQLRSRLLVELDAGYRERLAEAYDRDLVAGGTR